MDVEEPIDLVARLGELTRDRHLILVAVRVGTGAHCVVVEAIDGGHVHDHDPGDGTAKRAPAPKFEETAIGDIAILRLSPAVSAGE